jgi:GNAT superfamily N-acetyltransferase
VEIELRTPAVGELSDVVRVLREWQHPDAPMQLHPGDLGWFWQHGPEATAAAVRTWSLAGQIVALGLQDTPRLLRLTTAPQLRLDERLAQQVVADLDDPQHGVLPAGKAAVEAPNGTRVQELLSEVGWTIDEPWTPLRRDLTEPVEEPDLRIEVVGPGQAAACTAVHRSSFGSPRFTEELWRAMTAGVPYAHARCLLGYDDRGTAVAEVTVWSAGPGKPGLLEPMGVHAGHGGLGYGTAICLAAAAALQGLGSSSATVCTPSANAGAVATYESAGFIPLPQRRDRSRPG